MRALAWLALARVALTFAAYGTVRRAVDRVTPRRDAGSRMTIQECSRALQRASRVLIGTRCLARAVAGECLLRREGWASAVMLGVEVDARGQLEAHAWLESAGEIVTGGEHRSRYQSLRPREIP